MFFEDISNPTVLSPLSTKELEIFDIIVSKQLGYKIPLIGIASLDQLRFDSFQSKIEKFKLIENGLEFFQIFLIHIAIFLL